MHVCYRFSAVFQILLMSMPARLDMRKRALIEGREGHDSSGTGISRKRVIPDPYSETILISAYT